MKKFGKILVSALLTGTVMMGGFACGPQESGAEELTLYLNNGHYYNGVQKDSIWKKMEEVTGTTFSITGESHSGSYYTKLSPLMNTLVDAPDISFIVPSSADLGRTTFTDVWCAEKNGLVYSYEEMLKGFPEGTFPYIEKLLFDSQFKNVMQNGKHYLLPNLSSANSFGIYYRTDWLIAAGYYTEDGQGNKLPKYPTNLEEFTDVLAKFSKINELATASGITLKQTAERTYGFSPAQGPHLWMPLYHAFGVTPDWDIYGDSVDFMYTNAKFRNFLVWANEMYAKKYVYPTFNSLATNSERQLFYDGQIGVMFTNAETHVKYIMQRMDSLGVGDCVGFGPAIEGTENLGEKGSKGFSDWGGYWGGFCVSKTCKNIEGALKLLNYVLSPEGTALRTYGIEGVHYTKQNGEIVLTEENIENRIMEGSAFIEFENEDGEPLPTGNYEMGTSFGGKANWELYETTKTVQLIGDAYSMDQKYTKLVQDALDQMILKSSKLVNFSVFNTATTSAMTSYADTATSWVNSVIIGAQGYSITEWDQMVANLKATNKSKAMFTSANATCREYGLLG